MLNDEKSLTFLIRLAERAFENSRSAARDAMTLQVQSEYLWRRIRSGKKSETRSQRSHAPQTDSTLSPREQTVLALIVQGCSTREIAAKLGVSFKTASTHRTSIMNKLMVHKSAALVREAYRRGLVQ
jgi:DNA-binding NarL/FixJ family response regulator